MNSDRSFMLDHQNLERVQVTINRRIKCGVHTYMLEYFSAIKRNRLLMHATTAFPGGSVVKNRLPIQEMWVRSLRWEDALEEEMEPTPVFLPGMTHGQRSLASYLQWGHKVSEKTATKTRCNNRDESHYPE